MGLIKYMGSADVRVLKKGEDFGGRLATPLDRDLVWDADNNWVVDTDQLGLSGDVSDLMLTVPGFQNVTGQERVPLNENQVLFKGLSDKPRTSTLPEGYIDIGALPTSADNVDPSAEPSAEATEFAAKVNDTPNDPIITTTEPDGSTSV